MVEVAGLLAELELDRAMLSNPNRRPACAGRYTEFTFDAPEEKRFSIPASARTAARTLCANCPVLEECDRYATERRASGLWGGAYRRKLNRGPYRRVNLLPKRKSVA